MYELSNSSVRRGGVSTKDTRYETSEIAFEVRSDYPYVDVNPPKHLKGYRPKKPYIEMNFNITSEGGKRKTRIELNLSLDDLSKILEALAIQIPEFCTDLLLNNSKIAQKRLIELIYLMRKNIEAVKKKANHSTELLKKLKEHHLAEKPKNVHVETDEDGDEFERKIDKILSGLDDADISIYRSLRLASSKMI